MTVNYDSRLTAKTDATLRRNVLNTITSFSTNELQEFSKELRISKLSRTIDDVDTSIVGNTIKVNLKKSITPTLNQKLNYTISFNNEITHPHAGHIGALTSSEFSIKDGQDILRENCKFDDVDGVLRIFRIVNGKKEIVYPSIGTIDYINGKILLQSFSPTSYNGSTLDFTVIPQSSDVKPLREQVVLISESNISLTMNDIASVRINTITSQASSTTTTTATSTTSSTASTY